MLHRGSALRVITTGLAVFSMFFGAGNLIFAVNLGREFQSQIPPALIGFLLTGVCLPLVGIVSITQFGGDCRAWFAQAGRWTGGTLYVVILLIIGPLVPMPRIVALAYTMLALYLPGGITLPLFATCFVGVTFLCAVAEKRVIELLGGWISPLLLLFLAILVGASLTNPATVEPSALPLHRVLGKTAVYGYNTTDFITSVYFGSIIIAILRKNAPPNASGASINRLCLASSALGLLLQGVVYVGLAYSGARLANSRSTLNEGEVLAAAARNALGHWGGLVMGAVVALACLSTLIALAALLADHLSTYFCRPDEHSPSCHPDERSEEGSPHVSKHGEILRYAQDDKGCRYRAALLLTLLTTGLLANLGLSSIIRLSAPVLNLVHPTIIALAAANILYKRTGIQLAKPTVWIVLTVSLYLQQDQLTGFVTALRGG
ncbi:MAG: branched-chain amino acid transport system II carrier protein [Myxococcota bacterium]